jgi:site-specific DNA-methyltransferase (adenine-specific)
MSIELFNIDCLEYMATIPDKYFDLALTDPPYNVGRKYNTHDDNMNNYQEWCDTWFTELFRISKTIVMTIGTKNLQQWMRLTPRHVIIWHKPAQASPSPLGGFNAYEPILFWGENHKRIGHDIFTTYGGLQKEVNWHDCPKHLPSWTKILDMCINPPGKIFDPFLGSGTGALAAHKLGFDFIGTEIAKEYYDAAVNRFNNATAQVDMFAL